MQALSVDFVAILIATTKVVEIGAETRPLPEAAPPIRGIMRRRLARKPVGEKGVRLTQRNPENLEVRVRSASLLARERYGICPSRRPALDRTATEWLAPTA